MELMGQRHRTVRAGLAIGHEVERVNGAAGSRATWMGKPKGRYEREHMSQCGQRASFNRDRMEPDGISDIEGKVARVATSKLGNERVSNPTSARSTMPCSSSAQCRCPLSPRGSTASSPKAAKILTRIWSRSRFGEHRLPACWFR